MSGLSGEGLLRADAVVGGEEFLSAGDVEVEIGGFLFEINERYMVETVDGRQQGLMSPKFFEGGAGGEDSGFFSTVRSKKSKLITERAVVAVNWIGNVGRQIADGQAVSE